LQSTIEELETSNEELQSTNEELMSTNEELQSTNEELHSVNEELYTVSAEHQRKNDELTERDTDLNMLLQLSKIGTVHLDQDLRLMRYTNKARSVFNIMPQDVGRPFSHITLRALDHDILSMVDNVKKNQLAQETQLVIDENIYLIRILPYLKDEKNPKGVLITVIDVTDLQSARWQIEQLDTQYKDIVENTDSFIVRWEAETHKITYCNERYAQRWNRSIDELIGESMLSLHRPGVRSRLEEFIRTVSNSESSPEVFPYIDVDGNKRSVRVKIRGIKFDGDIVKEYQANGNDCTEEQNYKEAIEQLFAVFSDPSKEPINKLKKVLSIGIDYYQLESAEVGMIVGGQYTITAIAGENASRYADGSQFKLEETISGQFIKEDQSSLAIENVSASELNGAVCHTSTGNECFIGAAVHTAIGPYGSVSFTSSTPRTRVFTNGEINFALLLSSWIGYLIGNIEQLDFLSSQNEYHKSLFQFVPSMMFLSDADGLVISSSDLLSTQLGYALEDVPGQNCHSFFHQGDWDTISAALQEGRAERLAVRLRGANDRYQDVELNMTIKQMPALRGIRMVTLTDVSERKRASDEIREQNRRLELANENLNQFAFIASHDLQEPLRKIQQFSSFLEEDLQGSMTDEASYHIGVIVDASQRMSTLISDLLSYSGTSKLEPVMEPINLDTLVKEVVKELEMSITESDAKIELRNLPRIVGNKQLLKQLLTNLISNSIKYRAKTRNPKIMLSGLALATKAGISIVDNGIGFDQQFARKIFEPFNRLHNSKEYKGNGIGLAICRTVCEKHGWSISAKSEPDVGTTFSIVFNNESSAEYES